MKDLELKRNALVTELNEMMKSTVDEKNEKNVKRSFTADEQAKFDKIAGDVQSIEQRMKNEKLVSDLAKSEVTITKEDKQLNAAYSIGRALKGHMNGNRFEGAELEAFQEAERQFNNSGQNFAGPNLLIPHNIVYQRATFGTSAGANLLSTFKDPNVNIAHTDIVYSKIATVKNLAQGSTYEASSFAQLAAFYATESTNVTQLSISPAKKALPPRLAVADIDVSRQFIAQAIGGDDSQLVSEFQRALDRLTDQQMGYDLTGNTQAFTTSASTYASLVALDGYMTGNATAFLSSKRGKAYWETKTIDAGSGVMCWTPQNSVHGLSAYASDIFPNAMVAWGNFSDYYVVTYGGLSVLIDPYSLRKAGDVGINVSRLQNQGIVNPASFATIRGGSFL